MARKSKYTKSYNNAYRRYRSRITAMERKGYVIPKRYYIERTKPSKRAIERLDRITFRNIKKNLSVLDIETGEIILLSRLAKQEKPATLSAVEPKAAEKTSQLLMPEYVPFAQMSDVIIANFRSYINENFGGSPFKQYVFEWLDQMRAEFDDEVVARKLEQAAQQGLFPDRYAMYNIRAFVDAIGDLTALFNFTDAQQSEIVEWFSQQIEDGGLL